MGLRYFRIGINASLDSQEKLVSYFTKHPNVGWIFDAKGWFNLAVGIWAHDNAEINDISSQIRSVLTRDDEIVFQSELTTLYSFGNADGRGSPMCIVDAAISHVELSSDDLDYIKIVAMDNSLPLSELANILGVSSDQVELICAKLVEKGVIVGSQKRVNYQGTYFKVFVDTVSALSPDSQKKLTDALWNDPNCIFFARANSKYDLEFEIIADDDRGISSYLQEFADYRIIELTRNRHTNLYPLAKTANFKDIKDALVRKHGNVVDFSDSKLWYLNYKGADAYLSIFENEDYAETMEKSELELFREIVEHIKNTNPNYTYSVADIGSGDGKKARVFIQYLDESSVKAYYPVDIQPIELASAIRTHAK